LIDIVPSFPTWEVRTKPGAVHPLFTDDAITLIHTSSRGKPRSTNRLAISALIAACAANKTLIDEASARSAITDNHHDPQPATP
jgi:type II secretory pathway predicted ATPase ExeA